MSGGSLAPSLADMSVTIADDVPILLVGARRVSAILSLGNRRGSVGPWSTSTCSLSQGLSLARSLYFDDGPLRSLS